MLLVVILSTVCFAFAGLFSLVSYIAIKKYLHDLGCELHAAYRRDRNIHQVKRGRDPRRRGHAQLHHPGAMDDELEASSRSRSPLPLSFRAEDSYLYDEPGEEVCGKGWIPNYFRARHSGRGAMKQAMTRRHPGLTNDSYIEYTNMAHNRPAPKDFSHADMVHKIYKKAKNREGHRQPKGLHNDVVVPLRYTKVGPAGVPATVYDQEIEDAVHSLPPNPKATGES